MDKGRPAEHSHTAGSHRQGRPGRRAARWVAPGSGGAHRTPTAPRTPRPGRTAGRLASIAVIGTVAALGAGIGAFAAFTASSTSSAAIDSGDVEVAWVSSGSATLAVPIDALRPGQTVQRLVELRNAGSLSIDELQLVVSAANTDVSDGLQLAISDCSVPWGGTSAFTCGGVETVVSDDRPLRGVVALPALGTRQVGGNDYLRLTVRLPLTAPAALQNAATSVTLEVLGNRGPGRQR